MVPSWNFTVRPVSFEAAPVAAANVDALDSAAIIALTAGRDQPSAAPPSVEMNCRLRVSTAICLVSDGARSAASVLLIGSAWQLSTGVSVNNPNH
jgi:hypothetical protein